MLFNNKFVNELIVKVKSDSIIVIKSVFFYK